MSTGSLSRGVGDYELSSAGQRVVVAADIVHRSTDPKSYKSSVESLMAASVSFLDSVADIETQSTGVDDLGRNSFLFLTKMFTECLQVGMALGSTDLDTMEQCLHLLGIPDEHQCAALAEVFATHSASTQHLSAGLFVLEKTNFPFYLEDHAYLTFFRAVSKRNLGYNFTHPLHSYQRCLKTVHSLPLCVVLATFGCNSTVLVRLSWTGSSTRDARPRRGCAARTP